MAFAASAIAEWAVWVGVLVYAYERGGSTAAGLASLGLLVPGVLLAPFAGSAADGPRPNRALAVVYALQAASLVIAAVAAWRNAPVWVIIGAAAMAIALVSFVRPCCSVVVPGLVHTAGDLTGANVLTGWCESASVLFGPLLATVVLTVAGPWAVFVAAGALLVLATVVTAPLARLDQPPIVHTAQRSRIGNHANVVNALFDSGRTLSERPGARSLVAVLGAQFVLIGALDLLYVVLAFELLGLGAAGPGSLSAAFGIGAVLGVAASTLLIGRRRLASLLLTGIALSAAGLLVLAIDVSLAATLVVLPLIGMSRSMVDLAGRMLLQRAAPQDALASVFAILEVVAGVGLAAGSVLVQVLLALSGPRGALVGVGVCFVVLLAMCARGIRRVEASADAPVVVIRLLRMLPVFAGLPGPALEGIARSAEEIPMVAGDTIVAEGDLGDRYFAIAAGEVEVSRGGQHIRTMSRPAGFGEIALLADVPRTATVRVLTDGVLVAIDRVPFLTAVTGHDSSVRSAWAVADAWLERDQRHDS